MKDPSKEKFDALIAQIPDLLPDDPAMAAVIADELARQFSYGSRPLVDEPPAHAITQEQAEQIYEEMMSK